MLSNLRQSGSARTLLMKWRSLVAAKKEDESTKKEDKKVGGDVTCQPLLLIFLWKSMKMTLLF